jgi:hypothetical protein
VTKAVEKVIDKTYKSLAVVQQTCIADALRSAMSLGVKYSQKKLQEPDMPCYTWCDPHCEGGHLMEIVSYLGERRDGFHFEPDTLITTKAAAKILGVAAHTLETWRSTGRCPELRSVRIGRRAIRYWRSDVLRFAGFDGSRVGATQ